LQETTAQLRTAIESSQNIIFFGGAGVSTESGIPDFRSAGGLYSAAYPPEDILHKNFLRQHPSLFFQYYFSNMVHHEAKPNAAHKALAAMERGGRLKAVVTQNIDGLHQKAGSENVYELHGSVNRNYCVRCAKAYTLAEIYPPQENENYIPTCQCGGMVRPDVVLYGERLNEEILNKSIQCIQNADMLIVGGTSLVVYPAASLIQYFRGETLVLINRDETQIDRRAGMVFRDAIGKVLGACVE
jgi:NAD-dependent deacetylase